MVVSRLPEYASATFGMGGFYDSRRKPSIQTGPLGQAAEKRAHFLELLRREVDHPLRREGESMARDLRRPHRRAIAHALALLELRRDRRVRKTVPDAPHVQVDLRVVQQREERLQHPRGFQVLEIALQEQ